MRFGKNQPKPRGFNYRPFYINEQEEERKKLFGHLHGENSGSRNFRPSFRKKKKSFVKISPVMIRLIILLVLLVAAFILINEYFYIPNRYLRLFK